METVVGGDESQSAEPVIQQASAEDEEGEEGNNNEEDILVAKAQSLLDKITSSPDNPNADVLHALASILESQELR